MDALDRKILTELQLDGRLTVTELAARVKLSVSPCHRRVRDLERTGACLGTTSGEPQFIEELNNRRKASTDQQAPGWLSPRYPSHVIPHHVAVEMEFGGPCLMIPTACAAGNYAIGYACDLIR